MAQHVAVDVHDRTLYVLAVDADTGEQRLRRRFPHTEAGVTALAAQLGPGDTVVMEATRGAHSLANRLDATGATVLIADAQRCRSIGLRGKKTDYRDCRALLTLLRCGELPTVWRPDPKTRELRQLSRERHAANQQVTQLKNRLLALLREEGRFPPPGDLLFGPEGDAWLAALPLPASTVAVLRRTWSLLQGIEAAKQFQERAFAQYVLTDPRAWRLLQIPGFGVVVAAILLAEVGDFARFPDGKHLVSYAGLDPCVDQTGDHRRLGHISRGGRSQLRWILVEAAWAHVLAKGPEAVLYHRLLKKGKPAGVAIVALARHLLVLAHLLLTKGEPYRGGDAKSYLRKLAVLASFRPAEQRRRQGGKQGQWDLDWARERFRELTGQEPPRLTAPAAEAGTELPAPPPGGKSAAPSPPAEEQERSASGAGTDGYHAPTAGRNSRKSGRHSGAGRSPAQPREAEPA